MDALTAVVDELHFTHVGYRWLEYDGPFRVPFNQDGLRGVHAVTAGECDLDLGDGETTRLVAGDVVILPRGDSHSLVGTGPCTLLCGAFVVPGSRPMKV